MKAKNASNRVKFKFHAGATYSNGSFDEEMIILITLMKQFLKKKQKLA